MARNVGRVHTADVSRNLVVVVRKIGVIGFLAVPVPFAGEDAFATNGLETAPQPTDPGEEVDEGEGRLALRGCAVAGAKRLEKVDNRSTRLNRPIFPAVDLALGIAQTTGRVGNGKPGLLS